MPARTRGFTLVELLVVIVILAILGVVGSVVFTNVQKGARDARRKADVEAISLAFENKNGGTGGYVDLADTDFSSGKIPTDPTSSKGNYFRVVALNQTGYKVCASLDANPASQCNSQATNCYCKVSTQSTIANTQSSNLSGDSSSILLGYGYSGSAPSCDPNGALTSGLAGYWKMDEGSGNTASDSSGNGNSGSWAGGGTHWIAGKFGTAGSFDGTANYINIPLNLSLRPPQLTVVGWAQLTSNTGCLSLISTDMPGGEYQIFAPATTCGGNFFTHISESGSGPRLGVSTIINTGQWYLFGLTYDGVNERAWLNGANLATGAYAGPINYLAGNLKIGSRSGSYFFNGRIDDLRIYNRALSQPEMTSLYNSGNGCVP